MPKGRGRGGALPRLAVWIACLASTWVVSATTLHAEPEPALVSRTYRSEDGLPTNVIFALAQDRDGYLWIGGASGLVRFDGLQFAPWGAHGEPPLPYSEIRSLLADRVGNLWVGFADRGVVTRISGRRVHTYTTKDGLPEGLVAPRLQDRHGVIWAVGAGGIAAFRADRWEQRSGRDGLPNGPAMDAREDRSGALWISTAAGIFRRPLGGSVFELVDPGLASALAEDAHGRLWAIHSRQGIRLVTDAAIDTVARPASTMTGASILSDSRGNLWVGSTIRPGLHRISGARHPSQLDPRPVSDERGVFDKIVLTLFQDREGNVWAGTTGGLLRFYEPKVQTYSRANGLPDDNVRAVETTRDGQVWIGTASGLANTTPAGLVQPTRLPGVEGRGIYSLHTDGRGRLWVGFTDATVGVLAGNHFAAIAGAAPGGEPILTMRPDAQGGLWLCRRSDQGIYYWAGGSTLTPSAPLFHPRRAVCSATLLDRHGRVWLGFEDGSLIVYERDRKPTHLHGAGAPRGRVCALHEGRDGSIWLATTAGLSRYHDGKFSTVAARSGLPGEYVTAVLEDHNGDLWAGVSAGIIRLTKDEFEHAASAPGHQVRYRLYDASDGINDAPVCAGDPPAARDRDGRLWFASVSGTVVIDPGKLQESAPALPARVERVVADGVVLTGSSVALPARTANVELHYTAVSLSAASKIRFQYRLHGFDTSWINAGNRRQAFYTNLGPGRYRFEARASINETVGAPTVHEFDVRPAFYQTHTFYGGTAAAVAILLWGTWRLRVRALHNRYALIMSERARIGREMHDTILQTMAGVALQIESVARQMPPSVPAAGNALARITDAIKEHIAEARRSIWELRNPEGTPADLEDALTELADDILGRAGIRFEVTIVGTARLCNRDVERELVRIAREALRNAERHAGATWIHIELHYTDNALRLVISDNGGGFDVDKFLTATGRRSHWGLVGMKERARRIGAQFSIQSRAGAGTAIETVVRVAHGVKG